MNKISSIVCLASFALATANLQAAMTLSNITFGDSNAGEVTISSDVAGTGFGGGIVFWNATHESNLLKLYQQPSQLNPGATSWSTTWNPYFRGRYDFRISALDIPPSGQPSEYTPSHTISEVRAISGDLNSIEYMLLLSSDGWAPLDTAKAKLFCTGPMAMDAVTSIGCNILNANYDPQNETDPETVDIGFTDISANYPADTDFRFNVDLHARPHSLMGMGDLKRFAWTPDDPNNPSGPGNLVVIVSSCSPWRTEYAAPLGSHVGFAPIYFADEEDAANFSGGLLCTTAHYMDVSPAMDEGDENRIGLVVKGHPGSTNFLQAFVPDTLLQSWGITNVEDEASVRNQLGFFVDGLQLDESVADPEVTRLSADSTDYFFDWNGDGQMDSGYLVKFSFVFPAETFTAKGAKADGTSAQIGPKAVEPPFGPVISANGQTGTVEVQAGAAVNIAVSMAPGQYAGTMVDWWAVACKSGAQPQWYCLSGQWDLFDINNIGTCKPAYSGALFALPTTSILNMSLPEGEYQFWFAVEYPMDGFLDLNGQLLMATVRVSCRAQ